MGGSAPPVSTNAPTVQGDQGASPDTGQPVVISDDKVRDEVIGDAPANSDEPAQTLLFTADEIVAALESVINRVFSESLPSVVEITVQTASGGASGSGFVWDNDNHIVTNQHVIANAQRIEVAFADGRSYAATVLGEDADADVAVLEVDTDDRLTPIRLGDSDTAFPGQLPLAIGNPFGAAFPLTQGTVSAVGRRLQTVRNRLPTFLVYRDATSSPASRRTR